MTSLKFERRPAGDTMTLVLSGQIDEQADYGGVGPNGAKKVVFDFEHVKLINSTGLQKWIRFLEGIDPKVEMHFARCAIRVVNQINMFPGFVAGRTVKIDSFFAPYFCESCDQSCDILLDSSINAAELSAGKAPKAKCPRCKGVAEFDGIEKKYFLFAKAG